MSVHLQASAQVLALASGVALSCFGWGSAAARLLRGDRLAAARPVTLVWLVWLGWSCSLLALQLLHLAVPLTARTVVWVYAPGLLLAFVALRARTRAPRSDEARPLAFRRTAAGALLVAPLGVWVASRAMAPPLAGDYGLYYHGTVQWLNALPLVPGLGNFQLRYAFNQTPFVFIASLNLHPVFGQGRVVALTFLTLMLVATVLTPLLRQAPRNEPAAAMLGSHERRCALFLLPLTAYIVVARPQFSSASPDLFATELQIAIFLVLCRAVDRWREGFDARWEMGAVALLAATAVTVKLSSLVFAAAAIALAIAAAWRSRERLRSHLAMLVLPVLTLAVWSFRGTILSGMPLFPATFGWLPVDWAVPRERAVHAADNVASIARQPGATDWTTVLGRGDWLGPWMDRVERQYVDFAGPVACLALLTLGLGWAYWRRARPWRPADFLLAAPPLLGVIFCLALAPNPRFLGAQLWLLVAAAASLVAQSLTRLGAPWPKLAVAALLTLLLMPFFLAFRVNPRLRPIWKQGPTQNLSLRGFSTVRRVKLRVVKNSQGFAYYVPRDRSEHCWDAPFPCARRTLPFLLRDADSVRAGFRAPAGVPQSSR